MNGGKQIATCLFVLQMKCTHFPQTCAPCSNKRKPQLAQTLDKYRVQFLLFVSYKLCNRVNFPSLRIIAHRFPQITLRSFAEPKVTACDVPKQ